MAVPSSEVTVEGVVLPRVAVPPGSSKTHFLAGGGVRGMEVEGNFVKIAAIGVYLEDAAVAACQDVTRSSSGKNACARGKLKQEGPSTSSAQF